MMKITEDLFLDIKEHKILIKFKHSLENRYNVQICIPDIKESSSQSDVIFGSVKGSKADIKNVKEFVSRKVNRSHKTYELKDPSGVTLITLSDSEEESSMSSSSEEDSISVIDTSSKSSIESSNDEKTDCSTSVDKSVCIIESANNLPKPEIEEILVNSFVSPNDSVCIIDCLNNSKPITDKSLCTKDLANPCSTSLDDSIFVLEDDNLQNSMPETGGSPVVSPNDSVCVIECLSNSRPINNNSWYSNDYWYRCKSRRRSRHRKDILQNKRQKQAKPSRSGEADICRVTSTTEEPEVTQNRICKESLGSIKILFTNNFEPAPEFIAINNKRTIEQEPDTRSKRKKNLPAPPVACQANKDMIAMESASEVHPQVPRRLRPIVIDGSNVAREHGKVSDTFSAKGIRLCVDYFLSRGHTQVTAFVPNFRRHCDRSRFVPTTDSTILEELAKKQHVVFTPSRYLNGQCVSSYDDRFMVQLASQNGGVIVSNDNFKDLVGESESFKEAIEQRLLMFCFVGDVFMVPDDPLGRNGPKLTDYLLFPPEESIAKN